MRWRVVVQVADLLETKKLIPDLATWVQCFSLYAAVVVSGAGKELAYMSYTEQQMLLFTRHNYNKT